MAYARGFTEEKLFLSISAFLLLDLFMIFKKCFNNNWLPVEQGRGKRLV